jgi:hypothetical protein
MSSRAEQATGLGPDDLWLHIDTLSRYGIARVDEDFDGRRWVKRTTSMAGRSGANLRSTVSERG